MKPRTTLIIVGLFALVAGYVYFIELNKPPQGAGGPTLTPLPSVFTLAGSEVNRLELLDLRSGRRVVVSRTEGGWNVDRPESKQANSLQVEPTITRFTNLQANRVLTTVTDLGQFGVLTGTLEARVVMSDTTQYAIIVGAKSPDGNNYYATYAGDKSQVFLLPTRLIDDFLAWFDNPPYQPTPTSTFTPTPPQTPTPAETPTSTSTPSHSPTPAPTPTR